MSDQEKANVFAVLVLAIALAFAVTESRVLLLLRRDPIDKATTGTILSRGRSVYFAILFALSLLSFPATTLSLVASFTAPWQLLWPAALLFLACGVTGLLCGAWLLGRGGGRTLSLIVATPLTLALAFFALSIFLVRWR
jgi:hypothetical protein